MFNYKCEKCIEGQVKPKNQKNYEVKIFDESFIVKEAIIGECDNCGNITYNGKEMHRWDTLYKKWLHKSKLTLSGSIIIGIRKSLGLNRQEFAELIGVTRQSISVWEQKMRQSVQPRSIDNILRILNDEINLKHKPFTQRLFSLLPKTSAIKKNEFEEAKKSKIDRNNELKNLLPVSIWRNLAIKSKENNSDPFTETIQMFMTIFDSVKHSTLKIKLNPEVWNKPENISSAYTQAIRKSEIKELIRTRGAEA